MHEDRGAARHTSLSDEILGPVVRALSELGFQADTSAPPDRLLDEAAAALNDVALGTSIVRSIPLGGLGLLDYALCTSPTLRDALVLVVKNYTLITDRARWRLVESPRSAVMEFERVSSAPSHHWTELSFAAVCLRIRQTSGIDVVFEVEFAHPAPPNQKRHDEFFLAPVRFARPKSRFSFSSELLDRPLLTANAALAALLEQRIGEIKPTLGSDPLLERIRGAVARGLDERDWTLAFAARALRMSRRTLQRALTQFGTSHRQIVDEIRCERARTLLGRGLKVQSVAFELGFADPSAFFRAFRRWTGTSPRQRRGQSKGSIDPDVSHTCAVSTSIRRERFQ